MNDTYQCILSLYMIEQNTSFQLQPVMVWLKFGGHFISLFLN